MPHILVSEALQGSLSPLCHAAPVSGRAGAAGLWSVAPSPGNLVQWLAHENTRCSLNVAAGDHTQYTVGEITVTTAFMHPDILTV